MPSRIASHAYRPKRAPRRKPKAEGGQYRNDGKQTKIITAKKPGRRRRSEDAEIDPEAEARVKAFFARMIRPP
jgi:hypothetical protein